MIGFKDQAQSVKAFIDVSGITVIKDQLKLIFSEFRQMISV